MTIKPISECNTVQELLASPERWIKNNYYKFDEKGYYTKFCLMSAVAQIYEFKIGNNSHSDIYAKIYRWLKSKGYPSDIINFNDAKSTTWEEIIGLAKELNI